MGNKRYCSGCRNDVYNHGFRGTDECWSLKDAKVVKRKEVHISDVPPWNTQPIKKVNNCYQRPKYAYVDPDRKG